MLLQEQKELLVNKVRLQDAVSQLAAAEKRLHAVQKEQNVTGISFLFLVVFGFTIAKWGGLW